VLYKIHKMKHTLIALLFLVSISVFSQKKVLDHKDFAIWNTIEGKSISPNGNFIMYSIEKGEKDNFLKIQNSKSNIVFKYDRGEKGKFTNDSKYAIFKIKPWKDSIVELKRKKVKKEKLPKDSLGIYNLSNNSFVKIGNVKSYKVPTKWSNFLAYQLEKVASPKKEKDSLEDKSKEKEKKKKVKKVGKDNGYHLVVRDLNLKKQDTFKFVTSYILAEESKKVAFTTSGEDNKNEGGVFVYNIEKKKLIKVFGAKKAKYYRLNFSDSGANLGFVVDTDTTKVQVRPNELYTWKEGEIKAIKLLDKNSAPKGYRVSSDGEISFSKDDTKLYFGLAKPPIVKDTTLIDEEIVNVEVWTYDEPRLYTVQELQVEKDKKKSYETVFHLNNKELVQLATIDFPESSIGNEGNAEFSLVGKSKPYKLESQWTGETARDYAIVNVNTGKRTQVLTKFSGRVRLSPNGQYIYGYDRVNKTWFTLSIKTKKYLKLTEGKVFYDELNDSPVNPYEYGTLGWSANDESIFIYDRYDIWEFNPENGKSNRLTTGRESKKVYRYLKLDKEERFVNAKGKWLLSSFNDENKNAGFYQLNKKTDKIKKLISGDYRFTTPLKAKENNKIIYTRETFNEFPNIILFRFKF